MMFSHKLFAALSIACFLSHSIAFADELMRDSFDRYATETWGVKPTSADLVFRNQLNQTDGAIRLNPKEGGSQIVSDETYRQASIEFEAKVDTLSDDSTIFYYFGFHNTQPWTEDLLWLVVQDRTIKVQAKEKGGAVYEKQIGEMPLGKWVKFAIIRNGKEVEIKMDGQTVESFTAPEVSDSPMSAFFGANSLRGAQLADLQVDSVEITGDSSIQGSVARQSRQLGAEERQFLTKQENQKGSDWQTSMKDGLLTLSSSDVTYVFSIREGITIHSIDRTTPEGVVSAIKRGSESPLYLLKVGEQELDSRDVPIKTVSLSSDLPIAEIIQFDPETGIETAFTAELHKDSSLVLSLNLTNRHDSALEIGTTFPLLQNVQIGEDLKDLHYFFPWRGGLMGSVACNLSAEYGALGWMQVMAAFNPKTKSGIYLYPEDSTGIIKGLMIKKAVKGSVDRVNFSEAIYPGEMPGLNLAPTDGLGMAIYYKNKTLASGAVMKLPSTRLKAYSGDWREPLEQYVTWTKNWYKPATVPRWFKDSFTFLNQHPPSYYNSETKSYIGANALQGSEDMAQWAFWESLKVPHVGPNFNGHPEYQPGDFVPSIARGGLEPFKEEIERYQEKGVRFVPYINYRFCLKASEVGTKHEDWAAVREPGGDYIWPPFPPENLCMSFYDSDKWPSFMAATCKRLVEEAGIDGIYLDELCLQYPNYNPLHDNWKRGEATSTEDIARNVTMVRNAMKEANPEAILKTEHAGSDFMSQFIDGSWDQTFCHVFPWAEQYFDSNRLVFFRFCFPSFKLAAWGMSERHVNRYFFNGMGWDFGTGDKELSRILGNILKENGDAISTLSPEPLVPTSHPNLLANRFDAINKIIYTFYNVDDKPLSGSILEKPPFEGHYVELVDDVEMVVDEEGRPLLTIKPETVKAIALLKNVLTTDISGDTITVSVPAGSEQYDLYAYPDVDDSQLLASKGVKVDMPDGNAKISISKMFAEHPRRVILKLSQDGYLRDQRTLQIPAKTLAKQ